MIINSIKRYFIGFLVRENIKKYVIFGEHNSFEINTNIKNRLLKWLHNLINISEINSQNLIPKFFSKYYK